MNVTEYIEAIVELGHDQAFVYASEVMGFAAAEELHSTWYRRTQLI